MKDIDKMTIDELKTFTKEKENQLTNLDIKEGECFLEDDDDDNIFLYKIISIRIYDVEVEQIQIAIDNHSLTDWMYITNECVNHDYLEDLTKINKELYKKVYNLVSKYENEMWKFRDNYLGKITKLLE